MKVFHRNVCKFTNTLSTNQEFDTKGVKKSIFIELKFKLTVSYHHLSFLLMLENEIS